MARGGSAVGIMTIAVWVTIVIVIVVIVVPTVTALLGIHEALALELISLLDATSSSLAHHKNRYHENNDEQTDAAADQSDHGHAYTRYLDSFVKERLTSARLIALGDRFR